MIQSVEIKNLRGIHEGRLDGLTPLTILVGPNGCGKSTVLDALLLAASPGRQNALGLVKQRHALGPVKQRHGHVADERWLRWKGEPTIDLEVVVSDGQTGKGRAFLSVHRSGTHTEGLFAATDKSVIAEFPDEIPLEILRKRTRPEDIVPDLRLLESPGVVPDVALHQLYTKAVQSGRRDDVMEMVSATVPGATGVEILTEGDKPVLHILLRHYTVPVALAGDGVHALFRLILELASSPKGLVLLEEPECHQHPGNIRLAARSILAAVRRGIQVILATHSLEFIDMLLGEAGDADLQSLSVHRLNLRDGELLSHRLAGPDVAFSRREIEDDLR